MQGNIIYYDIRGHDLSWYKIHYSDRFLFLPEDKIEYDTVTIQEDDELEYINKNILDEETTKIITSAKNPKQGVISIYQEFGVSNLKDISIYTLYQMKFGTGKVTKHEMIIALLKDLLSVILKTCGLMIQVYSQDKKYRITTCWFTVTIDSFCKKIGSYEKEIDLDSPYLYYDVEEFKKELSQHMAYTGVSSNMCTSVTVLNTTADALDTIFSKADAELPDYLHTVNIRERLLNLAGLEDKANTSSKLLARLYNTMQGNKYSLKAESIVSMLENSGKKLKLEVNEGGLTFNIDSYRKDFTKDGIERLSTKASDYGLIIDCEGTPEGGCRELGMLIFCKVGDILINVKGYRCNESQIAETLSDMYKDYAEFIERYIPSTGIPCYVYGPNDKQRILNSLVGKKNKSARKTFDSRCKFIDCQGVIKKYVGKLESYKLGDIAYELKVAVVTPKHDPLNDCKTLFNILAKMVMLGERIPEK